MVHIIDTHLSMFILPNVYPFQCYLNHAVKYDGPQVILYIAYSCRKICVYEPELCRL